MSNIFSYLVRDTGGYVPFNSGTGHISNGIKSQHLWLDTEGAVYAVVDGTIDHWGAGLPFDVNGRLVVSSGAPDYFSQGLAFTADGMLATSSETGTYYSQGLIYAPDGALGATGSVLPGVLWTANLDGTAYGQFLSAWSPTGAGSTLSVTFFYESDGAAAQILDGDASAFSLSIDASDNLTYNLLSNVKVNGISSNSSGDKNIPGYYYTVTGDIDPTADIDILAATKAFASQFEAQLHALTITDPGDENYGLVTFINGDPAQFQNNDPVEFVFLGSLNSVDIDTTILAVDIPTETDILNGVVKIGDWVSLDANQPYVPVRTGDFGTVNKPKKEKKPNHPGNENGPGWEGGVNPTTKCITRTDTQNGEVGSWPNTDEFDVGDIWVASNCTVIQIVTISDADEICYSILQGNQGAVTKGFKYPNVFVGIKDVGGVNEADEWWYYNNGGTCPWPGLPTPDSPIEWVPNLVEQA